MPSGMLNKYSITIWAGVIYLWLTGLELVHNERQVLGFVVFLTGVLLLVWGLKPLKASPLELGIFTVLNNKTTTVVQGDTLTCPPFITVVVIDGRQQDHEFTIKPVTCYDGGIVSGKLSASILPMKADGQAMRDYDDAGQFTGVVKLLDDLLQMEVQEQARHHPADYVVKRATKIGLKIRKKILGRKRGDRNSTNDAQRLGCNFPKFALELFKQKEVQATEQEALMARALESMIVNRLKFYENQQIAHNELRRANRHIPPFKFPTIDEIRRQVLEEKRIREGKVEEVRGNAPVQNYRRVGG